VWGLHTSTEGETFDLEGVNPNDPIPWDLDDIEVERLRAASQSQGAPTPGGALGGLTPASDARTRKGERGERRGGAWRGGAGCRGRIRPVARCRLGCSSSTAWVLTHARGAALHPDASPLPGCLHLPLVTPSALARGGHTIL
jgi:hypothetical protein